MSRDQPIALAVIAIMGVAVAYAARLEFLGRDPRSHWLSLASGVTVGYVFLGLLPKLVTSDDELAKPANEAIPFLEDHALLVAMLGMVIFYGLALSRYAAARRARAQDGADQTRATTSLFWLTVSLHGSYMVLIGYLIEHDAEHDLVRMAALATVLTIHFVSTDFGLGHHAGGGQPRRGRLVLASCLAAGWVLGTLIDVSEGVVGVSSAFLAGAILLNVLNDELPEAREAHFVPFAAGALASALLLATIG